MNLLLLLTKTPGAEGAAGTGTEEAVVETLSIMELIIDGGAVMIPIGILSVIAVYIFVERFMAIRKASSNETSFMNNIRDFIYEGKIDSAKDLCSKTNSPIARMLHKGVVRIGKPLKDIGAAIENVGKLEVFKLEKGLAALATIAGAAPMIGFLGTVMGMIRTFHAMKTDENTNNIAAFSGGIMEAMMTTVAGLVVGIIAYIGYNMLVAKVEKVVNQMETSTIEFMDLLQEPVDHGN